MLQMKNILLLFSIEEKEPTLAISKIVFDRENLVFMRICCKSNEDGGLRARREMVWGHHSTGNLFSLGPTNGP